MTIKTRDGGAVHQIRAGQAAAGNVFRIGKGVAILDPHLAQEVNATSFRDRKMVDRVVDLVRGRRSPRVAWKTVRSAWISQLNKLARPPHVAELEARMDALVEDRTGRELDLPWAIQEIFTLALIPTVVADLQPRDLARLKRDQAYKLSRLMRPTQRKETKLETLRSRILQVRAGRVARRVLGGRAKGRRPRRLDLADPMVDMLPQLGMDRAAFAVTTVLTAIAGPPGAVAVCLLLELVRRPEWAERIREELATLPRERFHESPLRAAPLTYRFVRETLRVWSSPLVLTRVSQGPLSVGRERLDAGDLFHLSPFFVHHDPEEWDDPEEFDPDRWIPGADRGPAHSCAYVPFGWSPTSCVGAGLGTIELMLLASLFTLRYRIDAIALESVEILLSSVPLPIGFRGRIERRA